MTPVPATNLNPFAAPEAAIDPPRTSDRDDFFALFIRWERYRLIYNAILMLESLGGLVVTSARPLGGLIVGLAFCAIGANLCFSAGLVINGYAWWAGLRNPWITRILFAAGTILAMILAALILAAMSAQLNPGFAD